MAAKVFDEMPQRNCRRTITLILAYAVLEWILILLLFLNSFFSFLVTKFADYFALNPCCTFCSRLDRLWGSKRPPNFDLGHVCAAHGAAISRLSYCITHCRLTAAVSSCGECSFSRTDVALKNFHESNRCSCCDECVKNEGSIAEVIDAETDGEEASAIGTDRSNSDRIKPCNDREWSEEDESVYITDMLLQNADYVDSDRFICIELIDTDTQPSTAADSSEAQQTEDRAINCKMDDERGYFTMDRLKFKVKAQEKALKALYDELDEERKATAVAANEAMAMIAKLQDEKASIQIEALQYQRVMEEQAEYDQEALQLLNDLMTKREKEKQELERELETYRSKSFDYDTPEKFSAVGNRDGNSPSDMEIDGFGFDLCHKFDLEEFSNERLSIIEELKALEDKLLSLSENGKIHDVEGSLEKLDAVVNRSESEFSAETNAVVIREELRHVYERLQALESNEEFLKHSIAAMMKGDEGLPLLEEILQHLRGLRYDEFPVRNSHEIPSENVS
ncbi:myosin-binding protein 2-like [Andrographis paniculata]|uniref:myosin-binding protein 2-like n=1 Tax=Andrographis paniculata TaxID=175694 RepID=UPI0021E75907|nr:myosin-binding protein 2-like [Andrographis paniculata]